MTKQPRELALLAESGRLLASVFELLDRTPLAGLSTLQVDGMVEHFIVHDLKARPASKGQYGYGFVLNASVNDVVCHGIPSQSDVLRDGDIVNFDITLEKNDYIADSSKTYLVGEVHPAARRLVQTAYEAMWMGIRAVRPGAGLSDVGWAIERHAKRSGYSVVREFCGHGIGREMHEEPQVLHFGTPGPGVTLREGMVFTIEPMLNRGRRSVRTEDDGWTVVTRDGSLSAQFEHTVAVTASGVSVLTLRSDERDMLSKMNGVSYTFHDYKVQGIERAMLDGWVKRVGWETLLNRAGTTFRKLPDADKANLDEGKAIALMLEHPSLIKRPVLDLGSHLVVGFKAEGYDFRNVQDQP